MPLGTQSERSLLPQPPPPRSHWANVPADRWGRGSFRWTHRDLLQLCSVWGPDCVWVGQEARGPGCREAAVGPCHQDFGLSVHVCLGQPPRGARPRVEASGVRVQGRRTHLDLSICNGSFIVTNVPWRCEKALHLCLFLPIPVSMSTLCFGSVALETPTHQEGIASGEHWGGRGGRGEGRVGPRRWRGHGAQPQSSPHPQRGHSTERTDWLLPASLPHKGREVIQEAPATVQVAAWPFSVRGGGSEEIVDKIT